MKEISDPVITFLINRDNGEIVYRWTSDEKIPHKIDLKTISNLVIEIENIFPNGIFDVQVGIKSRDRSKEYAIFNKATSFEIVNKGTYPSDIYWKPQEKFEYK